MQLTIKSFGEDEQRDGEEDEEKDDLFAVVLDVVTSVFEEDWSSCDQLYTWFSRGTKRLITWVTTTQQ